MACGQLMCCAHYARCLLESCAHDMRFAYLWLSATLCTALTSCATHTVRKAHLWATPTFTRCACGAFASRTLCASLTYGFQPLYALRALYELRSGYAQSALLWASPTSSMTYFQTASLGSTDFLPTAAKSKQKGPLSNNSLTPARLA
jgi:hypothetical protein